MEVKCRCIRDIGGEGGGGEEIAPKYDFSASGLKSSVLALQVACQVQ